MSPAEPEPDRYPSVGQLTPNAIARLWVLGAAVRASPLGPHRVAAEQFAVHAAAEYVGGNVLAEAIARAMGISPDQLQQWRHTRTSKHQPPRAVPPANSTNRTT